MDKRNEKKRMIIEKARGIFLERGLFCVVMDDIAAVAGLTRRSLYRYFESKEELAYETAILLLNEWNAFHKQIFSDLSGDGLNRLEFFLNQLVSHMAEKAEVMKFLGEFDFYFSVEKTIEPSTGSMIRFNNIILESDKLLSELLKLGVRDLSIKEDTDIPLMVATISNVLWSFGQRIAIRNKVILKETGKSGIDLIRNQVTLYIAALKN